MNKYRIPLLASGKTKAFAIKKLKKGKNYSRGKLFKGEIIQGRILIIN